jgi:cytosine/adenosine deaminase-related metal-dependent hydrolase
MLELCAGIDVSQYASPADRIVKQVPADRDVLLIHNCCVTEEVIDMIEGHFTGKVTWVLCPRSNHYISRTEPPYELLRRKGVRIALGTDSLASNHSLEMIEEMKMIHGVPLEEILQWATTGGAEALGRADIAAGFEPGNRCGVVLIDGIDFDTMSLTPASKSVRLV